MGRLILQMQVSIDGHVSSASGEPWQVWNWGEHWPWDAPLKHDFDITLSTVGCILLSRKMIEQGYLDHWARMATAIGSDPHGGFARRIGEVEKIVPSRTLPESGRQATTVIREPLEQAVRALKRARTDDIICFGGTGLARSLVAAGVIDEYQFYVNPAATGDGESLFGATTRLRLLGSKAYDCGIVVSRYAHAAAG